MIKVYAGMSAQKSDVQSILPDAIYAPPVQNGDILSDIEDGVNSILILDGFFHQTLSVSPSEIMDALRRGIRVFGASSMGALRAAELEVYGMVGIGDVFEHIQNADTFRDDFLGQMFVDGWLQIQETFVTYIEFEINLKLLLGQRRVSRATYKTLTALYAELHYTERNLPMLATRIRSEHRNTKQLLSAATHALSRMPRPKHRDAQKALRVVSRYHDQADSLNCVLRHPLNGSTSRRVAKRKTSMSRVGMPLPELGAAYPAMDLLHALERSETIVYRDNGNRTTRPRDILKELNRLMSLVEPRAWQKYLNSPSTDYPFISRPGQSPTGTRVGERQQGRRARVPPWTRPKSRASQRPSRGTAWNRETNT